MSRVRVPQEQLGTGPLSVLSTPLPPINTPTVAGQLAGILSGGADVATRAVGFMAATQQMKNQEAILSIRNNEAAVREAEQSARQLEADEARNASIMRGEAGLAFDEVSGSIQEAFASGQMDAHIGRVPDAETLAQIANGFSEPATAGFGADSEYTKEFKRKVLSLVTDMGLPRQAKLQEIDRQSNITATQRDLATATTPEQVVAVRDQTKDTLGLTDAQWVEQVLTPALQGRAAAGDTSIVPLANQFIDDTRIRAALSNQAESVLETRQSAVRMQTLNALSLEIQSAGSDIGKLTAASNKIRAYQEATPEARATLDAMQGGVQSAIQNITNSAIKAGVEQKKVEFQSANDNALSAAIASSIESGLGYTLGDVSVKAPLTYTKADGTTETDTLSYSKTKSEVDRAAMNLIHERAAAASGGDPVLYRRARLNEIRNNAMVDYDLSQIGDAGVAKLSQHATASEETPVPQEAIEGFSVFLDSRDIAPQALSLKDHSRRVYELASHVIDSGFINDDPSGVSAKARALSWAIRNVNNPTPSLSEQQASVISSAARSVTASLFADNFDEETRVSDATEYLRDKATFYLGAGMSPEKAIAAATKDAKTNGRNVNETHWTYLYTPMPQNANGKTLDQNLGLVAEKFVESYGKFNQQDEAWLIPGTSGMSKLDVKFQQLPSGRWVVTDDRNPYGTSLVIGDDGRRMPELTTAQLAALVDDKLTASMLFDSRVSTNDTIVRYDLGVPARPQSNP